MSGVVLVAFDGGGGDLRVGCALVMWIGGME